jgi:hypothetical protein
MTMFSTSSRIRTATDHDGVVLLDVEQGVMINLNTTGGYIWNKVQAGKSADEIIADLACDTGEDPLVIADDVHQFLGHLIANRFIIPC